MQSTSRSLRSGSLAAAATLALLVTSAPAALAAGGDAEVTVDAYDCTSVDLSSTKDLSNVVLEFADGDRQRFEGLRSRTGSFAGTGDNSGEVITTAWVKSGSNASGDGPGYGERKDLDSSACDTDRAATANDTASGQQDGQRGGATSPDDQPAAADDGAREDRRNRGGREGREGREGRAGDAKEHGDEAEHTTGSTPAVVTVDDHDCTSVDVSSTKDLSNVVLEFADGSRQRFEGLTGRTGTFAGTGDNAGKTITTAWVKSGANHSGDGPGHGERKDLDTSTCTTSTDQGTTSTGGTDTTTGTTDTGATDTGTAGSTDDVDTTVEVDDEADTVVTAAAQADRDERGDRDERSEAPSTEASVLGSTDERELNAAADTDIRAADQLPLTGANSLAALLAALGALGLGTGLVRRGRRA